MCFIQFPAILGSFCDKSTLLITKFIAIVANVTSHFHISLISPHSSGLSCQHWGGGCHEVCS